MYPKIKITKSQIPLIVIFAGILFSLYLQSQISHEVFFSGDAGIKALLAKQFSSGNFRFDLDLPAEPWVRDLWEKGLYPFEKPFIYKYFDHYYITFPFTFPLITAPFYNLFGFKGLYIIPLIATWVLWFRFYVVCRNLCLDNTITSIALVTTIFSAPLTLYSAMYWEHTLAVSLAFYGLSIILIANSQTITKKQIILSGILIGFSVWFRPEFLCLVAAIWLTFIFMPSLKLDRRQKLLFVAGSTLAIAGFFSLNTLVYGHPLGIHAIQVVERLSLFSRTLAYITNFQLLIWLLIRYFPIVPFLALYFIGNWIKTKRLFIPSEMQFPLLISTLFIFAVPLILPDPSTGGHGGKQWGPRFWLILIPILGLVAVQTLKFILRSRNSKMWSMGVIAFSICLAAGIAINSFFGVFYLGEDYHQRVLPAMEYINNSSISIVATANSSINQELESLFNKKTFFLVSKNSNLQLLSRSLIDRGYNQFLYISVSTESVDLLDFNLRETAFSLEKSQLGQFGSYNLFKVRIVKPTNSSPAVIPENSGH